jgi:hypothetical protein
MPDRLLALDSIRILQFDQWQASLKAEVRVAAFLPREEAVAGEADERVVEGAAE